MRIPQRRWLTVAVAIGVTGCATFPVDRGLRETRLLVADRSAIALDTVGIVDCSSPSSGINDELSVPLTAESAVRVSLLCNPSLAASYARLGIARAEAFQAGRLANPSLSTSVMDSNGADSATQWDLGIAQSFTSLLLRGPRQRLAEGEFLRAQQLLAGSVLTLAIDVKSAYFKLIAAQQIVALRGAAAEAAQTSAELARAFQRAGNMSARELALDEANAARADADARDARNVAVAAHAELRRLLGVSTAQPWSVPDVLPLPVAEEDALESLQSRADTQRLDLAAARKLVELLADSARTTQKLRWLGDFSVGVEYERETDRSRLLGPTLSIQLPLFDAGQGKVARAMSLRDWGEAERRRLALDVVNAVDLACSRVRSAREQVEGYRTQLIPKHQAVVAQTQKEVNFMLRGVFELIEAKRDEYLAYEGYIGALRDYWIARADLERAVGTRLPSDEQTVTGSVSAYDLLTPNDDMTGMQHGLHRSANDGSTRTDATDTGLQGPAAIDHGSMDHESMKHVDDEKLPTQSEAGDEPSGRSAEPSSAETSHQHHDGSDATSGERP